MYVIYKVPAGAKRETKINTEKRVGRRLLSRFIFVNVCINKYIRVCSRSVRIMQCAPRPKSRIQMICLKFVNYIQTERTENTNRVLGQGYATVFEII